MSDLGAIFHVKKAGVQYDAHAYTTIDECPEPNLKINFKGQQGYIKLEAKGEGDVPCYVKPKSEDKIYQVRKEAIPTGYIEIRGNITFTVPAGVKVIYAKSTYKDEPGWTNYIGVTPNSVHKLTWKDTYGETIDTYALQCSSHSRREWIRNQDYGRHAFLLWSPEINKQTPDITDY